jgi:hypothetical protein
MISPGPVAGDRHASRETAPEASHEKKIARPAFFLLQAPSESAYVVSVNDTPVNE